MTKLGTPIGAGPKGAIVVVGLARVGAPPSSNWAPPSPASASGWVPPPVALGALTPPPLLPPPLGSPRSSLWVTPPRTSGSASSSSDSPRSNSLWFFLPASAPGSFRPDGEVEVEGRGVVARRWRRGRRFRALGVVAGRGAVRVFHVDQAVAVVVDPVRALRHGRGRRSDEGVVGVVVTAAAWWSSRSRRSCRAGQAGQQRFGHRGERQGSRRAADRGQREKGGERQDQCELASHAPH